MLVVWSALLGVLIFMGIVVVTLAFGAAANKAEKDAIARTEADRLEGLNPPIPDRYVEA